ncbi:MAG: NAD-dependent epimerase/dehydratase family protein [Spirochaetaceae bacterium]
MTKKIKNILVTGGLGFLGQHLVQSLRLKYKDVNIVILARNRRPFFLSDFSEQKEIKIIYNTSLTDIETLAPHFKEIDIVYHVAAAVSFWRKDKKLLFDVNHVGTENIIKLCKDNDIKRMIHISSTAALGYNNDKDSPATESFKFDWSRAKKCFYMLSKFKGEESIKKAISEGFPAIIVNPSTIFGPGDKNLFKLMINLDNKKVPGIMPGGFAAIDVRDLAEILVELAEKGEIGEQYLLTGGNYTFKEMFHTLCELLKVDPPKKVLPFKTVNFLSHFISLLESLSSTEPKLTYEVFAPGSKYRYYSTEKAKNTLGFDPKFTLKETLAKSVEEFRLQKGDI